VIACCRVQVGW